ncbi:AAA family ATPase [Paenibacillus sp. GYB004]|uniref:AAA family ATPase n=1 Tax=Paenibacillus sp. GYB004 TaxID=2994393 RepID=UPI002F9658DE
MRIHKIIILSKYKIFNPGQVFLFGDDFVQGIVGVNGSGKSILLELISNIFIEAVNQITKVNHTSKIEFEIIYSMVKDHMFNSALYNIRGNWGNIDRLNIKISNRENEFGMWILNDREEVKIENLNLYFVFFPRRIIVYSSGHNENISNEIYNYKLYSFIERDNLAVKRNNAGEIINEGVLERYNEIFYYFDDKISKLAILTAFLYKSINQDFIKQFIDEVYVESFKLRFDESDIYGNKIYFDEKVAYLLKELYGIHSTKHTNENGLEYYQYLLHDNVTKEKSALLAVFEGFHRLYEYNVYKIKKRTRKRIVHSFEKNKNLLIDWNIANNRVFELLDIIMRTNSGDVFDLRAFSDGEYQLLQLISILNIFSGSNNLFLLDEPETHFNPSWKSFFVSYLTKVADRNSFVIFTSHNPEVITDLKKENVINMKRGFQNSLLIETFGANPNIISANLFDKKNTVSEIANQKISEFRNKINQLNENKDTMGLECLQKEIESELGDSSERLMLLLEIKKRMK